MNNSNPTKTRIARKTRLLGLLAVAVSAIALVPAGASAKTVKATTNLDMTTASTGNPAAVNLLVKIDSSKGTCEKGRHMTLSRLVPGQVNSQELADEVVDLQLVHSIFRDDESSYTATVDRKVVRKGSKKIVCKPATVTEFPNV